MSVISRIFYFFSSYAGPDERAVGRFFKKVSEHGNQARTRKKLKALLQRDIATINLWSEYRYKGYRYLKKNERKKLYANLQLIMEDFERFYAEKYQGNARAAEMVAVHIRKVAPQASIEPEKAVLLLALTNYFSPQRGGYEYRKSSSFGRLLRDPASEKLIGDCNQIVTLYIYLYTRRFDASDLRLRILPGHVALHYSGVDIEATNGTFANYDGREGNALLPVEEIVSINLMDTTDEYLATHEVNPGDLLQASRLAYVLSHNRDIVTHNLKATYSRLIASLMKRHDYAKALKFAEASRDMELLAIVGHNGAVHEMSEHNFKAARRFAKHTPEREKLIHNAWHAEGVHHYKAGRYHDAITAFKHVKDEKLVQQCYRALFFEEQKKLGKNLTSETIKQYSGVIKRMHGYAKNSGNQKLIKYADNLKKYL